MAKIALFSDIHGNIEALEAVINDARAVGASSFACLGDLVGYGPNPSECIARVQEIGCVCIKGNHDEDGSNERNLDNLNDVARESLEWTRSKLSASQKAWLQALPYQKRLGRNLLVHATLQDPEQWSYIRNKFDAEIALLAQSSPLCFFGHTHLPVCYEKNGPVVTKREDAEIQLQAASKYLINVGSVGQPRDGIPKACYALYDPSLKTVSYRRVEYNIEKVVEDIASAGLSQDLCDRLFEAA